MSTTCSTPAPLRFGPAAPPSLLALRGIRLLEGENGAGAGGEGGDGGEGGQQQQQQGGAGNGGGQQQSGQQSSSQGGQQPAGSKEATPYERALRAEAAEYRKDRDKHAADLAEAARERDELRAWKIQREQSDAIRTAAGDNANAALLIDSGLFRREAEAAKLDFGKADAVKAFVDSFVEAHPEYGQTPALPGSGGPARHQGGQEVSLEQQLEEAEKAGRMEDVIGLKRAISQQRRSA